MELEDTPAFLADAWLGGTERKIAIVNKECK